VADASHIVLPGVGAFADCMNGLKLLPGMLETLQKQVLQGGKPFLGICVGMQMLFERGHEHGVHDGLGWLEGEVVPLLPLEGGADERKSVGRSANRGGDTPHGSLSPALPQGESKIKIPHMGWNDLTIKSGHKLL